MAEKQDSKTLQKLFSKLIKIMEEKAEKADILLIQHHELSINRDNDTTGFSDVIDMGVKLRAFDGKKYVEAHTTDISNKNLESIARKLVFGMEKSKIIKSKTAKSTKKIVKKFIEKGKKDPRRVALKKKIAFADKVISDLKKFSPQISAARMFYEENSDTRIYASKEKFLWQDLYKTTLVAMAFVKSEDESTKFSYEGIIRNGYEITDEAAWLIKKVGQDALKMIKAKKIVPGKYVAVLAPGISGLLAHESFGHGMESDTVMNGRAKSKDYIGKKIAKPYVSIIDYPLIKGKHGAYYFDDEGNFPKKTYLIKKGVVGDYLTEDFSAKKLSLPKQKVSANGRCESYDHKAYARMSNTYFEKGNDTFKKIISSVKDGIFLAFATGGGMEDPKSWGVQVQGVFGQRIKDGKLIDEYYSDISITGYLPDILGNIRKVSKEFEIEGGGNCGKGHKEWVPVSEGGPYLLIDDMELS